MKKGGEEAIFPLSLQRERKKKVLFRRHNVVSRCEASSLLFILGHAGGSVPLYGTGKGVFRHRPRLPQKNMYRPKRNYGRFLYGKRCFVVERERAWPKK